MRRRPHEVSRQCVFGRSILVRPSATYFLETRFNYEVPNGGQLTHAFAAEFLRLDACV